MLIIASKRANKCIKYKIFNLCYITCLLKPYEMKTQKCIIHFAENPLFIEHAAIAQISFAHVNIQT